MTSEQAARAWVEAWQRGWTAHDPAPIGERYADDALAELVRGAGTQFDPEIVTALVGTLATTSARRGDEA